MAAIITMASLHRKPAAVGSWIGATGATGTGGSMSIAVPAGTQSGDLLVFVHHGGADSTPSGFTNALTTSADAYGYVKYVKYKIASGETTINATVTSGFDVYLVALRGYTFVNSAHQFSSATTGGTTTYTVSSTPKNVLLIASDRGASSLPSTSTTGRTGSYTYSGATYFRGALGFYPNMAVSSTVTATDVNDTYNTSALFITVA